MTANNVNILNVLECTSIDLALWLSMNILDLKLPDVGPNQTMSGPIEALSIMTEATNRIMLVTELYVQVVGATPTQTSVRTNKDSLQEQSQEMNKRKDILYRTLQSLESVRDTASRMVTTANQQLRNSMQ